MEDRSDDFRRLAVKENKEFLDPEIGEKHTERGEISGVMVEEASKARVDDDERETKREPMVLEEAVVEGSSGEVKGDRGGRGRTGKIERKKFSGRGGYSGGEER